MTDVLVLQMWSLEFVEVAAEQQRGSNKADACSIDSQNSASINNEGGRPRLGAGHMNTASSGSIDIPDGERTAAEILQEFKDPESLAAKVKLGSSADSEGEYSSSNLVGGYDGSVSATDDMYRNDLQGSRMPDLMSFERYGGRNETHVVDTGVDAVAVMDGSPSLSTPTQQDSTDSTIMDAKVIDPKSVDPRAPQSPLTDFVLVTEREVKDVMQGVADLVIPRSHSRGRGRGLREGFRWQRQLVFRSKLTMHTAFERKDNKDPAAVTALAVSK